MAESVNPLPGPSRLCEDGPAELRSEDGPPSVRVRPPTPSVTAAVGQRAQVEGAL